MAATPLAGITVLEIGNSLAGPLAGMILAELGARVVKVENPRGGDYTRGWGPPFTNGVATAFQAMNRNKLGVAIDLHDEAQAAALANFITDEVDVVLHNLRFGALDDTLFSADAIHARKPAIIYCNIGAFGHCGPLREQPGYDPLMQAFSGIMSLMGEDGRPPVRAGISIVDIGTAMWAAIGILAALQERGRTGKGVVVDASLLETALGLMTIPITNYLESGDLPKRQLSGLAEIVPYQAFEASDGFFMIAAGNDNLYRRLCAALDRPDLLNDPRFHTNGERVKHRQVLVQQLTQTLRLRSRDHWQALLIEAGVPTGPIHQIDEVVTHPQVEALAILQEPPGGGTRTVGLPLSFDRQRGALERSAPALGEHTEAVLGPWLEAERKRMSAVPAD